MPMLPADSSAASLPQQQLPWLLESAQQGCAAVAAAPRRHPGRPQCHPAHYSPGHICTCLAEHWPSMWLGQLGPICGWLFALHAKASPAPAYTMSMQRQDQSSSFPLLMLRGPSLVVVMQANMPWWHASFHGKACVGRQSMSALGGMPHSWSRPPVLAMHGKTGQLRTEALLPAGAEPERRALERSVGRPLASSSLSSMLGTSRSLTRLRFLPDWLRSCARNLCSAAFAAFSARPCCEGLVVRKGCRTDAQEDMCETPQYSQRYTNPSAATPHTRQSAGGALDACTAQRGQAWLTRSRDIRFAWPASS